ncbi:MAG: cupin domain-containing protein [Actinomycetota bacterium]
MATKGYTRELDEGTAYWFVGTRMTVKAGMKETQGRLSLIECRAPAGYEPPAHIHVDEDEIFYMLEGALELDCAGEKYTIGAGGLVFLPRAVDHWFRVTDDGPARWLVLTAPGKFEQLIAAVGEVADGPDFPPPAEPDFDRLISTAAEYGINFILPQS